MADIFQEILPSILSTKKDVLKDDLDYKSYEPFVINRALSYYSDCLFHSNLMNMYPLLDKDMQYSYYLNAIRSAKRGNKKWNKKEKLSKEIIAIKEYFCYSNEKAEQALRILSKHQIDHIMKCMDKGGVTKSSESEEN
jgi:hypothetical protein